MTAPGEVQVCPSSLVVAAVVRRLRKQRGWNQDQLAGKAGLSRCMMSFIEAGRRNPSLPALERLAEALDTTPAALLGGGQQ